MFEELRALEEDVLEGDIAVKHALSSKVDEDIEELLNHHTSERFIEGPNVAEGTKQATSTAEFSHAERLVGPFVEV